RGAVCKGYFFFQAEDGIRDATVTGVQTCALPIYTGRGRSRPRTEAFPPAPGGTRQPRRRGRRAAPEVRIGIRPAAVDLRGPMPKIGRASCRERVENTVVAEAERNKKQSTDVQETE